MNSVSCIMIDIQIYPKNILAPLRNERLELFNYYPFPHYFPPPYFPSPPPAYPVEGLYR